MGRMALYPVVALTLVGLLAACGPPMAWQKPGVTLAEAQVDSRECAGLARDQAFRESFFGSPYGYGPGLLPLWPLWTVWIP